MGLIGANVPKDLSEKCFTVPITTVPVIENSSVQVDHSTVLDQETHISATLNGQKTVNENNTDYINALIGYIKGSPVTVTWFHDINSETYKRTFQTDWAPSLNSVHYSFQKINNFKFILKGSFTFSYDQATAKSDLTGDGVLYPYFCPYQSDMFIYEIEDGVYGLYKLTEAPIRLSIRSNTCHQIKFSLLRYLNKDEYNKLLDCVDQEVYFDLSHFMATGGGFLTSDETVTAEKAKELRSSLINFYNTTFYDDKVFRTYIDSPCLYDPYVIEFWTKIVDIDKMPGYPTQLVSDPKNWKRSFWFHLLYPEILPKECIVTKAFRVLKRVNYRMVTINALSNHCFICISRHGKHTYPPFKIPEAFDETIQTVPMEIKLYIEKGKIRPPVLMALAKSIYKASRSAQFYYIPILVFLLNRLISALENGEDIVLGDLSAEESCSGDCDNCILNCTTCGRRPCPPPLPSPHDCSNCCSCVNQHCHLIPPNGGNMDDPCIFDKITHDIDDGCEEYTSEE